MLTSRVHLQPSLPHGNVPFENPLISTPKNYGADELYRWEPAEVVIAQNKSSPGEGG